MQPSPTDLHIHCSPEKHFRASLYIKHLNNLTVYCVTLVHSVWKNGGSGFPHGNEYIWLTYSSLWTQINRWLDGMDNPHWHSLFPSFSVFLVSPGVWRPFHQRSGSLPDSHCSVWPYLSANDPTVSIHTQTHTHTHTLSHICTLSCSLIGSIFAKV